MPRSPSHRAGDGRRAGGRGAAAGSGRAPGGLGPERDDAALAALAAADDGQVRPVRSTSSSSSATTSPARAPVSSMSRMMPRRGGAAAPPSARRPWGQQALSSARSWSSVSGSTTCSSSLGDFTPRNGSTGISPSSASQAANRRTASWRARAVAAAAPPSSRSAIQGFSAGARSAARASCSAHHARYCATPVAVGLERLRALALGPQRQQPGHRPALGSPSASYRTTRSLAEYLD